MDPLFGRGVVWRGNSFTGCMTMKTDVFHFKYGWGTIQHHYQECNECSGTGTEQDEDELESDKCYSCNGEGKLYWGSYYYSDVGECDHCDKKNVPIKDMYEDSWVCLPCYITHHATQCGCDLWEKAETALLFK